ncbi:hypothetical protein SAMN02800692_3248 [Luteibacter sp. UNC138MFCol5.1]|uniref:DUF1109 domain-containing protein n=1 Tax=Luteibacter sp. UNC138MFCol5.1 TaxID=1502774 RepID=UPI0008C86093|nr:DUF1109 domain-containing protein [Luteibacter sp. UNC138MFCol5.1]SEP01334.1 hypothetical protein SAMN02800692_3248 [Luteibacter sp. UNC138MFCol5.1]
MKTDDLVALLAREPSPAPARREARRRFVLGLASGTAASTALMFVLLGVRPDLSTVIHDPAFWVRLALPSAVAVVALLVSLRLSRPAARIGTPRWFALGLPFLLAWMLAAIVLGGAEAAQRGALVLGHTWKVCSVLITLLSLPSIVAVFWGIRGMAPVRLRLAGAVAGLLAGAIAAMGYCFHCPEMAPPFWAIWYVVGMLVAAGIGALAGPRWLRW